MILDAIVRSPSLVEKVCQQLAGMARRNGKHDEGWLPTERELSTRLKVSRSVVREAVKRLEMQGLIEIRHGVGIRAVDNLHKPLSSALTLLVSDEDERLRQLVQIRFIMEPENARLAAEHASAAQLQALAEIHQALVSAEDHQSAVFADMEFHCAIAEASGNQIAGLLMVSLCDLLHSSLSRGYRRVTTESAIKEHRAILQAIEAHAPARAAKAMTRHIQTTLDELALNSRQKRAR